MQSMKETAANIGASAKSGMEKTKATLQEKAEKMTTRDPLQKEMAERKKEDRITEAELRKQEEMNRNAAARRSETYSHSSTGEPVGMHHMSALPGHGTGEPAGQVVEGWFLRTRLVRPPAPSAAPPPTTPNPGPP
ncbi:unnamed protein product [Thlaspi arvense]|uniref:Uncharacterized protein n=1 Tax=Thlaspi arvense TaxID=13288 RepID=A0AAU9RGS0_THLAR|nr:unnamed protein product [Thlaspi arvense]